MAMKRMGLRSWKIQLRMSETDNGFGMSHYKRFQGSIAPGLFSSVP